MPNSLQANKSVLFNSYIKLTPIPTPLDFTEYIPWVASQWELPVAINVHKLSAEDLSDKAFPRSKSIKALGFVQQEGSQTVQQKQPIDSSSGSFDNEKIITLKTFYDKNNFLLEVVILPSPYVVPEKLMQIFNTCFPFHSKFSRLILRKTQINSELLYYLAKSLPYSNLTDIYLDDTFVPQCNYSVLLEQASKLKFLSLCRCRIGDKACEDIASKLVYGCTSSQNLCMLDLTSNNIGDAGARSLGIALRSNRVLLYLNLSDNHITDEGASVILEVLMKFRLTREEVMDKRKLYLDWYKKWYKIYTKCLIEIKSRKSDTKNKHKEQDKMLRRHKSFGDKNPSHINEDLLTEIARLKTREIIGDILHPFSGNYTIINDDDVYCIGNLRLCSLNLSYNNIEYMSIKKIRDVLEYQNKYGSRENGILRVTLNGNRILNNCRVLQEVNRLLEQKCNLLTTKQMISSKSKKNMF